MRLVSLFAGSALLCACVETTASPALSEIGRQVPNVSIPWSLVTYDDSGAIGSVATGAEGPITIEPRCTYLSAYDKQILLIWPRGLSSISGTGALTYAGRTIDNGDHVSLRGSLHFDQARSDWPTDARAGCDYTNFMFVAPVRVRT